MLQDWAFAQKGQGITVYSQRGDIIVLEFNEFLGRIASGHIGPDDVIISQVMTDGAPRRVGDLKLYAQVISGQVQTENLPRRVAGGVLAVSPCIGAPPQPLPYAMPSAVPPTAYPFPAPVNSPPPVALLNIGLIVAWIFALLGFSLFCALRPGTPGTHPTTPAHFRPVTHPEHPPWLPR